MTRGEEQLLVDGEEVNPWGQWNVVGEKRVQNEVTYVAVDVGVILVFTAV